MAETSPRALFRDGTAMAEVLDPFCATTRFIKYGRKLHKEEVDKNLLSSQWILIRALGKLAPNFGFTKKCVEDALETIGAQRNKKWHMSNTELDNWVEVNSFRVRTLCQHCAAMKRKGTRWFMTGLAAGGLAGHQ